MFLGLFFSSRGLTGTYLRILSLRDVNIQDGKDRLSGPEIHVLTPVCAERRAPAV